MCDLDFLQQVKQCLGKLQDKRAEYYNKITSTNDADEQKYIQIEFNDVEEQYISTMRTYLIKFNSNQEQYTFTYTPTAPIQLSKADVTQIQQVVADVENANKQKCNAAKQDEYHYEQMRRNHNGPENPYPTK